MASDIVTPAAAVCPYCLWRITDTVGELATCNDCGTAYHADCFEENGGCGTFGCPAWLAGQSEDEAGAPAQHPALSTRPAEAAGGYCTSCGTGLDIDQRFCTSCGTPAQ